MIFDILIPVVALVLGGLGGYFIFRHVITGKYNEMMENARKEAEVLKKNKMLEVKEQFLNKKAELEKDATRKSSKARTG